MIKSIKKYLSILLIAVFLFGQSVPAYATEAQTAAEATSAEEASTEPQPEPTQQPQTPPESTPQPSTTPQPSPTPQPSSEPSPSPSASPNLEAQSAAEATPAPNTNDEPSEVVTARKQRVAEARAQEAAQADSTSNFGPTPYSGTSNGDNVGDITIETGDANNTSNLITNANSNLGILGCCNEGGSAVVNSQNGEGSNNNASAQITENNNNTQDNQAAVVNDLKQGAYTGGNKSSDNMGEDTTIKTGDANVTGTVITAVNTNVAGVAVSEFNVYDQNSDVILDFGASCISGCIGSNILAGNFGNGENSTNNADLTSTFNNNNIQTNDALINNNLELFADSGYNKANGNSKGDTLIQTGDANVSANALTFANNNLAGEVVYGVVNIFGDLVGDIILPESALNLICGSSCGSNNTLVANKNNLEGSDNNVKFDQDTNNNTTQQNNAGINNNLDLYGNTGENSTSYNGQGDANIKSGEVNVEANVLNIANSNIIGGNWWLVIVNEAGNWVGKLLGAPDGANFAGSTGTEFRVAENGDITAVNAGNLADSTNNTNLSQTTNNNLTQTNNAQLNNNLKLGANTGYNKANDNIGGDSKIETGDANIVANLVNFVNNNIAGGKLLVTVVNVFGSWDGDFITPGQKKQEKETTTTLAQGSNDNPSDNKQGNPAPQQTPKISPSPTASASPSTSPSPTAQPSSSPKSQVAGASTGGSGGPFQPLLGAVAASKTTFNIPSHSLVGGQKTTSTKSKIKINLAWFVLLFPIAGGYIALKNRSRINEMFQKKKLPV